MNAQSGIDHRLGILSHFAGADRVENGSADAAGGGGQFRVALGGGSGQVFFRLVTRQRRRGDDAPGQPLRGHRDGEVPRVAEVVGLDQRRGVQAGAADGDPAAAERAQVAHRGGEGGEGCSGSPKRSSDSGCTWYSRLARVCSGPDAANAPSWLGAIASGSLRRHRYSQPMASLPLQLLANWFSVRAPLTLNTMRSCRWSCRLAPTPGSA